MALTIWYHIKKSNYLPLVSATMINLDPDGKNLITGILFFKKKILIENLEKTISKFHNYKEITHVVKVPKYFGFPYYQEYPQFSLRDHIKIVKVPHPGGKAQLEKEIGRLLAIPLDMDKPLWCIHIFEDYYPDDHTNGGAGGSVLLMRVHHAIVDGMSMINLLLECAEVDEDKMKSIKPRVPKRRPQLSTKQFFGSVVKATCKILFAQEDEETVFFKPVTGICKASWSSQPVDLQLIKKVAKKFNASVNDVLFTCICGSIGSYLYEHSTAQELSKFNEQEPEIKTALWVNTRPITWLQQKPGELKNLDVDIGAVFMKLPLMHKNPVDRLKFVTQKTTSLLTTSAEPLVARGIFTFLAFVPRFLLLPVCDYLSNKISFSMSNVPGPQYPIKFAGEEIDKMIFFTPPVGRVGTVICMISYNGKVNVGCVSCPTVCPEPVVIWEGFFEEFQKLVEASEKL